MTRIYIIIGALLALAAAVWTLDSSAYKRGAAAGDARAKAAEDALKAAQDANKDGTDLAARLRSALAQCHEQNKVDVRTAQAASDAARADADRIAAELAGQNAKRLALQAGECRSWAEQAACGSVQ